VADARAHEPKLAALHAYAEGRLRPAARARLERHLARCATCRAAQLGLSRYVQLLDAARAQDTPAIDWARMQPALDGEAARIARAHRVRNVAPVAIGVALAACATLLLARGMQEPAPERARAPLPAPAVVPPAPVNLLASVTALAGQASATDAQGQAVALTLDSRPAQGWTLETGADGEVHLLLPDTAALIVPARSRVQLHTLHAGDVELALVQGRVVSQVRKRAAGERYDVLAGERRVAVRGTHFEVERDGDRLAVQVDEGVVQVLAADGSVITELHAPQRWSDGAIQPVATQLHRPLEKAPGGERWPALRVPAWPHVVEWELAGADFDAGAELAVRLPAGRHEILAHLDDGRRIRGEVRLDAVGMRFDPRQLRWPREAEPAAATRQPMDGKQASAVIRSAQPELQRCYERSMRGQLSGSPSLLKVRLRIDIDARGKVAHAELVGTAQPAGTLGVCIQQVASRWQFPTPGPGGLTFEAPLSFHPLH
jgi:hypothetical protein